jgi:hypothetical protein
VRFTRRPVYEAALIGDCSPGEIDAPCFLRPPPNDDPDIRQAASSRRALTVGPSRPSDTAPLCSRSVTNSVGGPLSAVDIGLIRQAWALSRIEQLQTVVSGEAINSVQIIRLSSEHVEF